MFLLKKINLANLLYLSIKDCQMALQVRGTGCRLASAIAHFYGSGNELSEAVSRGIDFLQNYLKAKLEIK